MPEDPKSGDKVPYNIRFYIREHEATDCQNRAAGPWEKDGASQVRRCTVCGMVLARVEPAADGEAPEPYTPGQNEPLNVVEPIVLRWEGTEPPLDRLRSIKPKDGAHCITCDADLGRTFDPPTECRTCRDLADLHRLAGEARDAISGMESLAVYLRRRIQGGEDER